MSKADDETTGAPEAQVLARFLESHPGGSKDAFEAWADEQPELSSNPELRSGASKLLEDWQRAEKLLAIGLEFDDGGSVFRRRSGAPRESAAQVHGSETMREGRRIGSFTLTRFIAKGGMGQVWEAEDNELRRKVALKLVLPDRIDARSLELFAREARAGGRLNHPNLVTTLAYGTDDGLSWIAQELVEESWTVKDSLDALRAEDAVPKNYYREVAELVAKIADGMQAVHDAGVIHRDLKPQNILIAEDDTPKVTDFGLARVAGDSVMSQTGDFAGTWAYMSPEQVTAKRMGLDHRTDVFSLGVVMYELLTLRKPFEGDTTHQIAQEIIYADPPDATKVRSQCPRELAVIVGKALEKVPGNRYGSMGELTADLRRHLANEPILATPPGALARGGKWIRRHPAISSASVVGAVALTLVSWLALGLSSTAEDLREQTQVARGSENLARLRTEELTRAAEDLRNEMALSDSLANAEANQRELAEKRGRELEKRASALQGALHEREDAIRRSEAFRLEAQARLAASKGEHRLGSLLAAESVTLQSDGASRSTLLEQLTQPQAVQLDHSHQSAITHVAHDPQNGILATAGEDGTVLLWSVEDRSLRQVMRATDAELRVLTFGPEGAILIGDTTGALHRWERGQSAPSQSVQLGRKGRRSSRGLGGVLVNGPSALAVADRTLLELDPLTLETRRSIEKFDGARPQSLRKKTWKGKVVVDCKLAPSVAVSPKDWSWSAFPQGKLHDYNDAQSSALVEVESGELREYTLRDDAWDGGKVVSLSSIYEARYNAEGTLLAVVDSRGVRLLRRSEEGAFVEGQSHDAEVTMSRRLYWSPAGDRLVHVNSYNVRTIDPRKAAPPVDLAEHRFYVRSVEFLGAGRLVTCGADGTLAWWDLGGHLPIEPAASGSTTDGSRGPKLGTAPALDADDGQQEFQEIHWSADGRRVSWATPTSSAIIDDSDRSNLTVKMQIHEFSADGSKAWSVNSGHFFLLDADTGDPLLSFAYSAAPQRIQLDARGRLLVVSWFGSLTIIDLEAGEVRRRIEADKATGGFLDSDLTADGSQIIVATPFDVRVIETAKESVTKPPRILKDTAGYITATGDLTTAVAIGDRSGILLWKEGLDSSPTQIGKNLPQLMDLEIHEKSERIISIHLGNNARVWSFEGEELLRIPLQESVGARGRFDPSGRWVQINGHWWPLEPETFWRAQSPPDYLFRELEEQRVGTPDERLQRIQTMELRYLRSMGDRIFASTTADSPRALLQLLVSRSRTSLRGAEIAQDAEHVAGARSGLLQALRWLAQRPDADASDWNALAWELLDERYGEPEHAAEALPVARRAVKATERKNVDILDTLALALFRTDDLDGAVRTQMEALVIARRADSDDERKQAEFQSRLDQYQRAADER